jgi:hypothetical protein
MPVTAWSQDIGPLESVDRKRRPHKKEALKEVEMVTVKQQKLESKIWRDNAARLRQCARMTREAERQRIFPKLADECETRARELEQSAEKQDQEPVSRMRGSTG